LMFGSYVPILERVHVGFKLWVIVGLKVKVSF
jgi:hypothetical protein